MGHFLSRAIKRFTQCNSNTRNQLAGSNQTDSASQEQQATVDSADPSLVGRFSSEAIPVGQSIDSAEYAAFKTAPSSVDKNIKDNLPSTSHSSEQVDNLSGVNEDNQIDEKDPDESLAQSGPQVEEAVIKIQALVRGHLTRKALKDAHQQAVPLNVLGQSQFDEESLRNPPNVLFSNVSPQPPQTNTSNLVNADDNQQQQSGGKLGNGRVPPLESIAEDVESCNAAASSSTRAKRKQSSPKSLITNSGSETSGESVELQSTSPSNEANASIDIHCDTPTSASIDILDHSNRPLAAIASVLHPQTVSNLVTGLEAATAIDSQGDNQASDRETSINNVELQNGSGRLTPSLSMPSNDQAHPMSTSSVPSTPPHINLALTTNSHSIDSAEAAAIRIQSAFRGYHTRKHSPYRRRSPGDVGGLSSPVALINGTTSNGQPKRSTLRQQDATVLDDEEPASEETEESRQSRLRHRLDEARSASGIDLPQGTPSIRATEATSSAAEDDQVTMTTREVQLSETAPPANVSSSNIANRANLTGAEQLSQDKLFPAKSGRTNEAFSLDTDSSNLGAALSLNEDLSEGLSQGSIGGDAHGSASLKRSSFGAALESSSDDATDGANQDDFSREQVVKKQLEELDRVTDQLEAALDEATDNEALTYGEELNSNVMLEREQADESQQNLNELESDDLERRHPSGFVNDTSPGCSQDQEQQAALVASSSLEDQEAEVRGEPRLAQLDIPQARLDAISPDEAIGSGGSSPALVESHDGNSTDDGVDSDQEQDGQQQEGGTGQADNQQSGSGGNKGGKKRRNRRRGKK